MKVKVLMVDDHPAMIEGYKSILRYNNLGKEYEFANAYDCDDAWKHIASLENFDMIFLDIIMPFSERHKISSGKDLGILIRKYRPNTKLVILTSHTEAFVLYSIIKEIQPEGFLVKSDVTADELSNAVNAIYNGEIIHSCTVKQSVREILKRNTYLDSYNRKIISLLAQGVKTKSMPAYLNLSISAIDKRKSQIKDYFEIEKGNDEDIIREAKKCGFI